MLRGRTVTTARRKEVVSYVMRRSPSGKVPMGSLGSYRGNLRNVIEYVDLHYRARRGVVVML